MAAMAHSKESASAGHRPPADPVCMRRSLPEPVRTTATASNWGCERARAGLSLFAGGTRHADRIGEDRRARRCALHRRARQHRRRPGQDQALRQVPPSAGEAGDRLRPLRPMAGLAQGDDASSPAAGCLWDPRTRTSVRGLHPNAVARGAFASVLTQGPSSGCVGRLNSCCTNVA